LWILADDCGSLKTLGLELVPGRMYLHRYMQRPGKQNTAYPLLRDGRLYLVFAITLMGVMGVSSITPAFPEIAAHFGLSSREVGLLLTVFTVPGIVLAPLLGFMSDRFGRKRILVPALGAFGLAGAAATLAPSFPVLLGLRFIQGAGAASLTSLSVTLLGDIYEGRTRERAVGYNASALSIGTASFPIVGGALAALGWRVPFLLPLLAVPVALFVLLVFETAGPEQAAGGASAGERLAAVIANARREGIVTLSAIAVLIFILLYGAYLAYMPFLLRERFNAPAPLIGAVMSTMSIATAVVASQRGAIAGRLSTRWTLFIAFLFYTAALVLIPLMPRIWLVVIPTLLYGVAQGLTIPTIQSQIAGRAPMQLRGATVAANAMAIRIGQTVGPLVSGLVFAAGGLAAVFWSGAAIPVAMLLLIGADAGRRRRRRRGRRNVTQR
jgi:MFS family permease